jgi:hypothetical protein
VLLIAKRLNGSKLKYRLRVYITLRAQVKVVDVADSHDPCEFRIMAPTKTFVLFGRNKEEKRNWIRWINNVIKYENSCGSLFCVVSRQKRVSNTAS